MEKQPFGIEMSTVGLLVWNPTNEDFEMQYAGITITLKAGESQAFAMNCAMHLLNGFGQRGLTSLVHGCTESEKKKTGENAIQRNLDFKNKQIVEYNQRNENRKQMGLGYLPPTEHVKKYARELDLQLLEPYSVRDKERGDINTLRAENAQQKQQITDLLGKFDQLMARLPPEPEPDPEKPDRPAIRPNFKR